MLIDILSIITEVYLMHYQETKDEIKNKIMYKIISCQCCNSTFYKHCNTNSIKYLFCKNCIFRVKNKICKY